MIAAGLLCEVSFLLMREALTTADSARILGVRNVSMGFTLRERFGLRQWLGIFVLFAGVAVFGLEQLVR